MASRPALIQTQQREDPRQIQLHTIPSSLQAFADPPLPAVISYPPTQPAPYRPPVHYVIEEVDVHFPKSAIHPTSTHTTNDFTIDLGPQQGQSSTDIENVHEPAKKSINSVKSEAEDIASSRTQVKDEDAITTVTTASKRREIERNYSLLKMDALPREYNTGNELEGVVTVLGIRKKNYPVDKTIFLGFLAGCWVVFSGLFAVSVVGGVPADVRAAWPVLPKLLIAITFPIGIVFILLFGGELFTGNQMIMTVAFLNKKVTFLELLENWVLVFLSNLFSIVGLTYLLGYVTDIFKAEPFHSYVVAVATRKANLPFHHMVLMGIPANALVCLAFFLGLAARDVTGKVIGLYLPVATFAASGWEHCVANMFFLSIGWYYGAPITIGQFAANIFSVALGNIIGGGFLVGGSEYFLYHWKLNGMEPTRHYEHGQRKRRWWWTRKTDRETK